MKCPKGFLENIISDNIHIMENKITEYENKIALLEKKVSNLEKYNASLRECLLKNVQFSTKLSNITYEMDCLLVKKGQEIRDLEKKIEQSSKSEPSIILMDFDMDIGSEEQSEKDITVLDSGSPDLNPYDYVGTVCTPKKLDLVKESNGYFNCSKCDYKTLNSSNFVIHYRCHTDEKPFGCKLCGKRFKDKSDCVKHIRTHDDRFKLKCSVCDARFASSQNIIRHVKKFHNGKGYERKVRERIKRKHDET